MGALEHIVLCIVPCVQVSSAIVRNMETTIALVLCIVPMCQGAQCRWGVPDSRG